MVEKLGGTIEVASKIGQGSRFSIRLPQQLKNTDDYNECRGENWVEKIKSRFTE
jgi:signal transduction histidine kinase